MEDLSQPEDSEIETECKERIKIKEQFEILCISGYSSIGYIGLNS